MQVYKEVEGREEPASPSLQQTVDTMFRDDTPLFQITEEEREEYSRGYHDDVKTAVAEYYFVPEDVLEQFRGEEWADRELAFRISFDNAPEIIDLARESGSYGEFLENHSHSNTMHVSLPVFP